MCKLDILIFTHPVCANVLRETSKTKNDDLPGIFLLFRIIIMRSNNNNNNIPNVIITTSTLHINIFSNYNHTAYSMKLYCILYVFTIYSNGMYIHFLLSNSILYTYTPLIYYSTHTPSILCIYAT